MDGSQPRRAGTSIEDAELIERVANGQAEAFADLVHRYQDRLFNTCWRICGHLEDARDLTQEAFLKAYENLATFRYQSSFYTWIYRVAVNLALSHRRSGAKKRMPSLDQLNSKGTQAEALKTRTGKAAEDPAIEPDLQAAVLHALQALEDEQRAVVVLRDIEGFDYNEIGVILDIPPGTVKSRLHRARMALREAIAPAMGPRP
jgi:RNA polymerase sigma-70 factor (ECF subfamily)